LCDGAGGGVRASGGALAVGSMWRRSFDSGAARSAVWQRRLMWPEHNGGERCCNANR